MYPFVFLHLVAMVSCTTSVVCSVCIIIHSFKRKSCRIFFRQGTLINRFQIYLAIGDLAFGIWHGIDHSYILITNTALNGKVCSFIGFMMLWAFNSMGIISCLVTFSAFIVVILEKKLRFWKFDLFLWFVGVALPFIMVAIGVAFNWIGFNGVWCGIREGIEGFSYLTVIYSGSVNWINIILSVLTYGSIFAKIIRSSNRFQMIKTDHEVRKLITPESIKMTKKFVIFVLVLLIQWMPLSIYLILTAAHIDISYFLIFLTVTFSNLGGLFNIFIYLSFRKPKRSPSRNDTSKGISTLQSKT